MTTGKQSKKVLLIGWDAADWKLLGPLMDKGLMPNLQKLVEGGVSGTLSTLDPMLSPTLWTSIATGKRPFKHGILGFSELSADRSAIRPSYITSRKVKAIWNILTQQGLKTNVVGWWPSHPAEPINGVMVSNFYQKADQELDEPWPMLQGTVHPASLEKTFKDMRIHHLSLTPNHIGPFVPKLFEVDEMTDKSLDMVARITAQNATVHNAATYIMEHHEWDLMAVYYDGIDHYCHGFMKYHPPKLPTVSQKMFEQYKGVVEGGCRFFDLKLGRLLELAGEDATVLLVSDHGFHADHRRPKELPEEPTGLQYEHSPYGIIAMKGPGIKKDELLHGASLLDITPTLLTLFGLPVAEDMDGKVLAGAFEDEPAINYIQSWENINGNDGTHPADLEISAEDAAAELKQLVELGYIEDYGDDTAKAVKATEEENNYNLARSYLHAHHWTEGIEILQKLWSENPRQKHYGLWLIHAYIGAGQFKNARAAVDDLRKKADRSSPYLDIIEGNLLMVEDKYETALKLFKKAEKEAGNQPHLQLRIGKAYLKLNKLDEAEKAINNELKINPEEADAYYSLGLVYHQSEAYEKAINAFLEAIGLLYYFPEAHIQLAESLFELKRMEEAAASYKVALKLVPTANIARQRLAYIYENYLNQPEEAEHYKLELSGKIHGDITIVSGLPRSGTSLLMQMLEAGGMEIFTDKKREADDSNPKGYYEHEAVKGLGKSKAFLKDADGKAVKVIANLLKSLPLNYRYHILFIERDLLEVIASQQKMLVRNGKRVMEDTVPLNLLESFQKTIDQVKSWAEKMPNVRIHFIEHKNLVDSPFMEAMLINDFLGGQLAVEKMAAVVDNDLYRIRKGQIGQKLGGNFELPPNLAS